jgi:hypothetical protein
MKMIDNELTVKIKDFLFNNLKLEKGYNIKTIVALKKGDRVFFKKLKSDIVSINNYFGVDWDSSASLQFSISEDRKFSFIKKSFKSEVYDTSGNNKVLDNLIKEIDGQELI